MTLELNDIFLFRNNYNLQILFLPRKKKSFDSGRGGNLGRVVTLGDGQSHMMYPIGLQRKDLS